MPIIMDVPGLAATCQASIVREIFYAKDCSRPMVAPSSSRRLDMSLPTPATLAPTATGPTPTHIRLSVELAELAAAFQDHRVTLGEILDRLGVRATALLVAICALPFCIPVTIPGMSTPFGFVILILSIQQLLGKPPWLPARIRRVALPPAFFSKVLGASGKVLGWMERRLRARAQWLVDRPWKVRLHLGIVIVATLLLMIPLPPLPPLTNTLPALVILGVTLATLERDGAGILAGYGLFISTVVYFIVIGTVVVEAFARLWARVHPWLEKIGF
jgi:hypothetical protein